MANDENSSRDQLIQLLQRHDWYYQYSDDHSAWTLGNKQRTEILSLLKNVPDGLALYNQYKPQQAI